jgi:hypothetical protein
VEKSLKKKGGRPKKPVKRDKQLAVMCTVAERFVIAHKAKAANLCISEYLRTLGVTGKIDMRKKALPVEVLQSVGILNHMAANLNQIAKKRNSFDELNALERAELQYLSAQFKELVKAIKSYLL